MSWDDYDREFSGGNYLKWDAAPFQVASVGEPEKREKHFENRRFLGKCQGEQCEHCKHGIPIDTSYDWPVLKYPEGVPATLTLTHKGMQGLVAARRAVKEQFDGTIFECSRSGIGPKVTYQFRPVGREPAETIERRQAVPF